jgi:putative transposase
MVTPHALYRRLGMTAAQRQQAYQRLFDEPLAERRITQIRAAINSQRRL